jgi:hypothetical protein
MKVAKSITIRIRKPRTIVLATVPSDSEPGKDHRICLDIHNMVFCTCKGWRYNGHTCPHLTRFREKLASAQEKIGRKK